MFKRMFSLLMSCAILVGCFVFKDMNADTAIAGAGNGVDESVETAEELKTLLAFIAERDGTESTHAYSMLADKDSPEAAAEKKYESATIHISTEISAQSSSDNYDYSGGVSSSTQSVSRQLTIFIAEDATYYVSRGIYSYEADTKSGEKVVVLNFDMEFAVMGEDVYMIFRSFVYTDGGVTRRIKASMANKWIEANRTIADSFIYVDTENRSVLSRMQEMIEYLEEHDAIDPSGVTGLNADDFNDIAKDGEDGFIFGDDENVSFLLDMSNPSSPYISLVGTVDSEDTHTFTTGYDSNYQPITTSVTIKNKSSSVQEISICNVNNTVISFDASMVTESIKDSDSEDVLFIKKEVEKDD